jgi:hypothetical protein
MLNSTSCSRRQCNYRALILRFALGCGPTGCTWDEHGTIRAVVGAVQTPRESSLTSARMMGSLVKQRRNGGIAATQSLALTAQAENRPAGSYGKPGS